MAESHSVPGSAGHLVWKPPARDIAILLNLNLVDRLARTILESPGQEIGGLLLGRTECDANGSGRRIVSVDGFEPLGSQHLRGPGFSLSQQEQKKLTKTVVRLRRTGDLQPVGFFRSHLRKGLYLDEADFSLFRDHFGGSCDVFLIARPVPGSQPVAGFFHWEDGTLHRTSSYSEFPLDRAELESGDYVILGGRCLDGGPAISETHPVVRAASSVIPDASSKKRDVSPAMGDASPAARPQRTRPFPARTLAALVFGIGVLLAASATAYLMHLRLPEADASSPPAASRVPLRVQRMNGSLLLSWNVDSPQVQQSSRGLLSISDGGQSHRLEFDSDRLRAGSYSYKPQTNDVTFKLDLLRVLPEASGSVRFVAPDNEPAPPIASSMVPPAVAKAVPRESAPHAASEDAENDDDEAPEPHSAPPAERESPAPSRTLVEPVVSITTEALPPPKYREVLAKVPLLREIQRGQYKAGDAFVPPKLSHEVMPRLAGRLAHNLPGEWRLDLKLSVDSEGSVTRIEVLTPRAESHLADAAVNAAEQWRFDPATLHGSRVSSEILATVQFHNPAEGALAKSR